MPLCFDFRRKLEQHLFNFRLCYVVTRDMQRAISWLISNPDDLDIFHLRVMGYSAAQIVIQEIVKVVIVHYVYIPLYTQMVKGLRQIATGRLPMLGLAVRCCLPPHHGPT